MLLAHLMVSKVPHLELLCIYPTGLCLVYTPLFRQGQPINAGQYIIVVDENECSTMQRFLVWNLLVTSFHIGNTDRLTIEGSSSIFASVSIQQNKIDSKISNALVWIHMNMKKLFTEVNHQLLYSRRVSEKVWNLGTDIVIRMWVIEVGSSYQLPWLKFECGDITLIMLIHKAAL